MTHDELVSRIEDIEEIMLNDESITEQSQMFADALRAVVELHKPDSTGGCNACEQWTNEGAYQLPYPCPTIQAIEKELG